MKRSKKINRTNPHQHSKWKQALILLKPYCKSCKVFQEIKTYKMTVVQVASLTCLS